MDEAENAEPFARPTARESVDHAASGVHSSHIAAIIVAPDGRVVDYDHRGDSFLKAGRVLCTRARQLRCTDAILQTAFNAALKETSLSGRNANLLLHAPDEPDKRFSLTLTRMRRSLADTAKVHTSSAANVLCLIAPLDGRRIATAQQLIDFFGLSRAEARLARAICHGDSVENYARDHDLRLPTVRTQLSSVFNKTGTDRQAELVRLVAGIPVVREESRTEAVQGTAEERRGKS